MIITKILRRVLHSADPEFSFSIPTVSASVWQLVEEALNFLTGHMLTALILVAYLIKRVGFGIWRSAKRSV